MATSKKNVKHRLYQGWIIDPKTKGHALVARGTNRQQCWLETAYAANKYNAKEFFIEDVNGKKTYYKR